MFHVGFVLYFYFRISFRYSLGENPVWALKYFRKVNCSGKPWRGLRWFSSSASAHRSTGNSARKRDTRWQSRAPSGRWRGRRRFCWAHTLFHSALIPNFPQQTTLRESNPLRKLQEIVVGPDVEVFYIIDKSRHIIFDKFYVCLWQSFTKDFKKVFLTQIQPVELSSPPDGAVL